MESRRFFFRSLNGLGGWKTTSHLPGILREEKWIEAREVEEAPHDDDFQRGSVGWGVILLMAEILHQLRLVVHPIIYKVLYIQVVVWDFFHQQYL